jgi:thioredoxin reductase (NADPH)
MKPEITIYGAPWCPYCVRAKRFLTEMRTPFEWIDIDDNPHVLPFLEKVNKGNHTIPTIVFGDDTIMVAPTNAELAAKIGLEPKAKREYYDLIVIGSGPAGLSAAIYAAREGYETLVIDAAGVGGQAGITDRIDNYPGFPQGVGGAELAEDMAKQAKRFGVEILQAQPVNSLTDMQLCKVVKTAGGDEYSAEALLLATGSKYRKLNVPGEDDLIGKGVHFCATCDGPFYKDRELLVVGGGNSGVEEGLYLTKFASKVTIVEFDTKLRASQVLQEQLANHPKVEVRLGTTVKEFSGNGKLSSVTLQDVATGETEEITPGGVFIFIGLTPNTGFTEGFVDLDQWGFIETGKTMETSVAGVYAAGDVRAGSTKQVAAAVGEGATAALMIRGFLETTQGSRGYKGDE